jgi:DNA-binding transcriptional regulator GbsR (MarR family)
MLFSTGVRKKLFYTADDFMMLHLEFMLAYK